MFTLTCRAITLQPVARPRTIADSCVATNCVDVKYDHIQLLPTHLSTSVQKIIGSKFINQPQYNYTYIPSQWNSSALSRKPELQEHDCIRSVVLWQFWPHSFDPVVHSSTSINVQVSIHYLESLCQSLLVNIIRGRVDLIGKVLVNLREGKLSYILHVVLLTAAAVVHCSVDVCSPSLNIIVSLFISIEFRMIGWGNSSSYKLWAWQHLSTLRGTIVTKSYMRACASMPWGSQNHTENWDPGSPFHGSPKFYDTGVRATMQLLCPSSDCSLINYINDGCL